MVTGEIGGTARPRVESERGREERLSVASKRGRQTERKSIRRERYSDTYVRGERKVDLKNN